MGVNTGRLCMVVHGPYPIGEPRVAREVRVALDEGFEVDVVALRRPGEPAHEVVEGAHVYRLPLTHQRGRGAAGVAFEYLGFTALASIRVAQMAWKQRYTVVQVHNPPDFLMLAAFVPKLLGARIVFDVHDLSPDMFAMRFGVRRGAGVAEWLLRAVERRAAREADDVITVHEPYRRELIARGVTPEKVVVVMNSLDERYLPSQNEARDADAFRVVYHGTVTPSYGIDVLLEAAALAASDVPDLRLEIYGEGDRVDAIRRQASVSGLNGRLRITGHYLPHSEVLRHVSGASVGVIPNLPIRLNRFALSSKLFEYVALGVPVVSADLPTIRAHFSDRELLYFRAGDAESLASALLRVAMDAREAGARAQAALRRYEQYRWPLQAERYCALLRNRAGHDPLWETPPGRL